MDKKYIIPIILFLIGMVIVIIGALFKLLHWPFATLLLSTGLIMEAISVCLIIVELIKMKK
jgi:uncharacterized membrane protein (DUF373 family)